MAGRPPKPPPPTTAAGSASSPKPRPTLAAGLSSSSPNPPPPTNFARHPSDEELMNSYLRPRLVSGTKLEGVGFIHEADLYSADPDLLTSNPKYTAATASNGKRAWYFFTPLRAKGFTKTLIKRSVDTDTGRKGTWLGYGDAKNVLSNDRVIGESRVFIFKEKVGDGLVKSAWRMKELRLKPNEGGQEARSSDLLALCKVYRTSWKSKAADESSMAVAKADGEGPGASAVVTPGREAAVVGIGADTAAGLVREKRKAGDEDSGAEKVASSPGRQNEADGEIKSTDAATTGQIFADGKDHLDAAEKAQQEEPRGPFDWDDPHGPVYNVFSDYSSWWWW